MDAEKLEQIKKEDEAVSSALKKVGVEVKSVYDLVNSTRNYSEAIPVLIEYVQKVQTPQILEGVVRALTVKEARGIASKPLIKFFEEYETMGDSAKELTKWTIGNALEVISDQTILEDLIRLAKDKKHGMSRDMLPRAIGKLKPENLENHMIDFLEDEDLVKSAIYVLGRMKSQKAVNKISTYLKHEKSGIREEAEKALAKIQTSK